MISPKSQHSIDWFKGKITGKSHISWEHLWFPVDFPLSQPIERFDFVDQRFEKPLPSGTRLYNELERWKDPLFLIGRLTLSMAGYFQ